MASEDNLGKQFTPNHKFTWEKTGKNKELFISCCWHRATNTGRPSDKRWALTAKGNEISTHRSSAAAKEEAMKLHNEGKTGF
jgi:hypothetical protein